MSEDNADRPWEPLFPYESAYPDQADAIDTLIDVGGRRGFGVVEGACGTGKTLMALMAGLSLVRDPSSSFQRVLVLTSVKQQLHQFEEDLRAINEGLPPSTPSVSGLTLQGKADVCPYNREGAGGIDETNVYERCTSLRERTVGLRDATSTDQLVSEAYSQQVELADSGAAGSDPTYLSSAGAESPFAREMPTHATDGGEVEYCPFYAQYLSDLPEEGEPVEATPFDPAELGLVDTEQLVSQAVETGSCPHSVMGALLPAVEVVIGNYYHAFDASTSEAFTAELLDDSTYVVCDEAHMLEPRVRDLVSQGMSDRALRNTEAELAQVVQPLLLEESAAPARRVGPIREMLSESELSVEDCQRVRELVGCVREFLDDRVTEHLESEFGNWQDRLAELPDTAIPLRDPTRPEPDSLSEFARSEGFTAADWALAGSVGPVVGTILDTIEEAETDQDEPDSRRAAPAVGQTLAAWERANHTDFFREIRLERGFDEAIPPGSWQRGYAGRLELHNCVPGDQIGEQLAEFGGGVLMSATLAPMDVFRAVSGLDHLEDAGRPIEQRVYGLNFPAENRVSFAVKAPKFTFDNRGQPGERSPTRVAHARAIRQVAGLDGNVLVGMPSYAEAEWAAETLRDRIDKEVLLDSSSSASETRRTRDAFFRGPGKVLVTSLRGTLTEGVDYKGDRLAATVISGVPIINTAAARTEAVRTAYEERFGDGFRTALLVPAVRKARQAIGRVIRGPDERGVRVLLDERYGSQEWDSVRALLGPDREEFQPVGVEMLGHALDRFDSETGPS